MAEASNENKEKDLPPWQLAKEGIKLLINNKQQDAEALFNLHPDDLHLSAGYAYAIVTDALMTFEDDKIHEAFQKLRDLEKKCSSYSGWINSMKSKVFGTEASCSYAEKLESQIILADVLVFVSTLTFLQQDISGYFKGGWMLRKSYKQYQYLYGEILGLYNEIVGDDNVPGGSLKSSSSSNSSTRSRYSSDSSTVHTSPNTVEFDTRLNEVNSKAECSTTQVIPPEKTESVYMSTLITTANLIEQLTPNIINTENAENENIESSKSTNEEINSHVNTEIGDKEETTLESEVENLKMDSRVDEEGKTEFQFDQHPSIPSSSSPRNGYILTHSHKSSAVFPKHSISCHTNLSMYSALNSKQCNQNSVANSKFYTPNGYVQDNHPLTRNADMQNISHLKKSSSVNNALCVQEKSQRRSLSFNENMSFFPSSFNIFATSKTLTKEIDKSTIGRLLCAVSFGYGLLQLGISLLPPSILKLTSFLGFGGNRKSGLEKLMYSRTGTDMRAPFATLALLWYHTIVRPFFALDGNNVQAGVRIASQLIDETKEEFGQSALFLFFKGRVERLNSDISAASAAFESSIENASQREIKMIAMHEVGWCYLITLNYAQSESIFLRLKQSSRWSRPFYAYLAMISAGANNMFQEVNDTSELRQIFQTVPKGTQLDEFLNRRYSISPLTENVLRQTSCLFWKLLIYELLYLWNALPSCTKANILKIIEDCCTASETNAEPIKGLSKLIEGSCHCILKDFESGIYCFQRSVEIRNGLPYNSDTAHVSAFAQYELGLLLVKKEKMKLEGKRILQSISRYKGYDFEQRLSVRVYAILKNL